MQRQTDSSHYFVKELKSDFIFGLLLLRPMSSVRVEGTTVNNVQSITMPDYYQPKYCTAGKTFSECFGNKTLKCNWTLT